MRYRWLFEREVVVYTKLLKKLDTYYEGLDGGSGIHYSLKI